MTAASIDYRVGSRITARSQAVPLLQIFAVTLMIFPSNYVVKAIGAGGYVTALIAYVMLLALVAATLFGLHNPFAYHYPVRVALCALWVVSLVSYVLMDRTLLTGTQLAAADRWLMELAVVSAVILVAAEGLRSREDIRRVLRALTWGGAFCGIVAGLQFKLGLDLTHYYVRFLPGFSVNQADTANAVIGSRNGLARVPGTATDPIELGVVAGMLLVLAVYLAIHDLDRSAWSRWLRVLCIAIAVPASVSRSAILSVGIAIGVLIVLLPASRRLTGLAFIPVAVAAIFVTAHGFVGTIKQFFLAGTSDPSIAHRVNNYSMVEQLVRQAPWFGQGGGTYIVQTLYILDNQYLTTAIELGLTGLVAFTFFLVWPGVAALIARRRTADPELRDLCAALAGAAFAAVVCSATFDSLSFPMFVNVQALVAGITGATWLLIEKERTTRFENLPFPSETQMARQ